MTEPECDGMCVMGYDLLGPEDGVPLDVLNSVAEPHPGCPLHAPGQVCGCGQPDRCMSPTHGQINQADALAVRHRQSPLIEEYGPLRDPAEVRAFLQAERQRLTNMSLPVLDLGEHSFDPDWAATLGIDLG